MNNNIFDNLKTRKIFSNQDETKITWLAESKDNQQEKLIIKQITYGKENYVVSGIESYKKKIQYLQVKKHPAIIKYLGVFANENNCYVIREYKEKVLSLAQLTNFKLEDIKTIAVRILTVLADLQESSPPIIHQNLKPENIFIDKNIRIYLTDFGFSEVSTYRMDDFSVTPLLEGTLGFVAPEQLIRPTKSSDMYGLGATLICLITKLKSSQLSQLLDRENTYQINFENLLIGMGLRPTFIKWLAKMVAPDQRQRFRSAREALDSLKPLYLFSYPLLEVSSQSINISVAHLGTKYTETIKVTNLVENTTLQGEWLVKRNPKDPPSPNLQEHSWITISPRQFSGNNMIFEVTISSNQLMAGEIYERELLLNSNAIQKAYNISLTVSTPPLFFNVPKPPYLGIIGVFISALIIGFFGGLSGILAENIAGLVGSVAAWCVAGIIASLAWAGTYIKNDTWSNSRYSGAIIGSSLLWGLSLTLVFLGLQQYGSPDLTKIVLAQTIVLLTAISLGLFSYLVLSNFKQRGFSNFVTINTLILTIITGMLVALAILLKLNLILVIPAIISGSLLTMFLFLPLWQEKRLIDDYRKKAITDSLIEP